MPDPRATVYTVGHGNRSLEELLRLLERYSVQTVVDVRRWPKSSKYPHFNAEELSRALERAGVEYVWLGEELGGYREGGYERHMETDEFRRGLRRLEELAERGAVAVLCAERLWFRCHRRFIADALVRDGFRVVHIVEEGRVYEHRGKQRESGGGGGGAGGRPTG